MIKTEPFDKNALEYLSRKKMKDSDCINFLQWALPQMHMQWAGFRKVRRQVCKRIDRRLNVFDFSDIGKYREYLKTHTEEWSELANLCRITISRFYRDIMVFSSLQKEYFPQQLKHLAEEGKTVLNVWSVGCGSGEEPYTLSILWQQFLSKAFPDCSIYILATDIDERLLQRAAKACYSYSSIKNIPVSLRKIAFTQQDGNYCLFPEYQQNIEFKYHDVHDQFPNKNFNVILCRNLVFTYFDIKLQKRVLADFKRHLTPNGLLVLGAHEKLPKDTIGYTALSENLGIYQPNK